ncbi:MAG: restriction endonuclease subunit S [Nostoc sp.]
MQLTIKNGQLLVGWEIKTLGEVCNISTGKLNANAAVENGQYPFFTCSREIFTIDHFAFDCEAILLAGNNAVGDFNVKYYKGKFNAYQRTYVITITKGESLLYKYLYLQVESALKDFKLKSVGAGTKFLKLDMIKNLKLHLPPLTEQKRIVAILDEAFEGIDRAIANAEKNLANARELFESYLNAIFTQKGDGWEEKKLGDVCEKVEYGSSAKSLVEGEIPVLRMGNIQNGAIDWSNLAYTIDKEEINKYLLRYNDVLFNRTNSDEHVGKTAIYKGEMPAIFAGYLIRIHRKEELIDADFLNFYLNSYKVREYGKSIMSRSVNQANINGTKLKGYPISLPALSVQRQIVENLSFLRTETQHLEAIYRQKLAALKELKQSILQKAFTGELTADTANQTTKAANEGIAA